MARVEMVHRPMAGSALLRAPLADVSPMAASLGMLVRESPR